MHVYDEMNCATFRRTAERHGLLSNMAGRMPLRAGGIWFQSSEGLYQALKYPHDASLQQAIGQAKNGFAAKEKAYEKGHTPMEGWDDVRIDAMRYALAVKLVQHPDTFGRELTRTGAKTIVESSRKDDFWGAVRRPAGLVGRNHLGRLLQELRGLLDHHEDETTAARIFADRIETNRLMLNGNPTLRRDRERAGHNGELEVTQP